MELILYTNNSDKKVVTKSITTLVTVSNGTLREACSIIDPIIAVDDTIVNNAIAAACNYAKLTEFGRYYYVTNVESVGKLWVFHMHVDVISSFQTQIKALDAVVARQESKYNLYLQDGMFKTYQNPHVSIKQFPSGFQNPYYVLTVAGAGGTTPTPPSNNSTLEE